MTMQPCEPTPCTGSRALCTPEVNPRLHTQIMGSGRPIVIQAPAWGPSSDYLRLTLAPLLEDFRVITFDPRNVGQSQIVGEDDAQATEKLVDDLEALRAELGLKRFVLIGHSHGGFISMGYAVRHGQYLDALVLLNTTLRHDIGTEEAEIILSALEAEPARCDAVALFRETDGRLGTVQNDLDLAQKMRRLLPAYFYDMEAMRRFSTLARSARPPSSAALARVPKDLEPWVEDGLPGVDVPTLVVTGAHDAATPPPAGRYITDLIPGARLEIFAGSGHHPWIEEPALFRRTLRAFFSRLDIDPGSSD